MVDWLCSSYNEDTRKTKINFLCPQGPLQSFKYPTKQNILLIPQKDILTTYTVDPRTITGHTYTITKQECKAATNKFKVWKKLNIIKYGST